MKILLIDPPFYRYIGYYNRYFPLGIAYLAALLREKGHEVAVYDADCNIDPSRMDFARLEDAYPEYLRSLKNRHHPIFQEIRETLSRFKPDVVGISVWTTYAASAFAVAALCKEYDRDLPVVMGGPHVTIKYDEILTICPHVDILVRKEGEETLPELIGALERTKQSDKNVLKGVLGISFRHDGEIIHCPDRPFIRDLDALPLPARDLLLNRDKYGPEDMGLLMTSRGCPYRCSYCSTGIWERQVRCRSLDNIVREIKFVKARYGTRQFAIKDDAFTLNRKRVMDFCDRIVSEKIYINWDCNARVDLVDEDLLLKMKEAGCNSIKVGIETGSERILKMINKNITLDQCRKAAKLFRKAGIHWTGYFMMGVPSETKEDMRATVEFMKELEPDYASFSVYEPFPGTALFDAGVKKGLVQPDRSLEDYYAISPKYYYVKDLNRRIDTMENGEFIKLENEMKASFHRHNTGLTKIAKRIRSRGKLYLYNPVTLWYDFRKFLSWI